MYTVEKYLNSIICPPKTCKFLNLLLAPGVSYFMSTVRKSHVKEKIMC